MKNIKKFNELNFETYISAADKMRTLGHKNRANSFNKHAYKMKRINKIKSLTKYGIFKVESIDCVVDIYFDVEKYDSNNIIGEMDNFEFEFNINFIPLDIDIEMHEIDSGFIFDSTIDDFNITLNRAYNDGSLMDDRIGANRLLRIMRGIISGSTEYINGEGENITNLFNYDFLSGTGISSDYGITNKDFLKCFNRDIKTNNIYRE